MRSSFQQIIYKCHLLSVSPASASVDSTSRGLIECCVYDLWLVEPTVAEFVDLEGYLYHALVCKHPQLWYPSWVLEPIPHGHQGTGVSFRAVLCVTIECNSEQ